MVLTARKSHFLGTKLRALRKEITQQAPKG